MRRTFIGGARVLVVRVQIGHAAVCGVVEGVVALMDSESDACGCAGDGWEEMGEVVWWARARWLLAVCSRSRVLHARDAEAPGAPEVSYASQQISLSN